MAGLRWDEIQEGDESPVYKEGPVTRTDIVKYAGAGGDFNPIHHDESFAKAVGLPSIFSMGLYQGGLTSRLAADWLGVGNLRHFGIQMRSQVWPNERLLIKGRILRKFQEDGERRVEVELLCTDKTGEDIKIKGTAIAAVS